MTRKYHRNHEALQAQAAANPKLRWQFKSKHGLGRWQTLAPGRVPSWSPFISYRAQPEDFVVPSAKKIASRKRTEQGKQPKAKPIRIVTKTPAVPVTVTVAHAEDTVLYTDALRKLRAIIDVLLSTPVKKV